MSLRLGSPAKLERPFKISKIRMGKIRTHQIRMALAKLRDNHPPGRRSQIRSRSQIRFHNRIHSHSRQRLARATRIVATRTPSNRESGH